MYAILCNIKRYYAKIMRYRFVYSRDFDGKKYVSDKKNTLPAYCKIESPMTKQTVV